MTDNEELIAELKSIAEEAESNKACKSFSAGLDDFFDDVVELAGKAAAALELIPAVTTP